MTKTELQAQLKPWRPIPENRELVFRTAFREDDTEDDGYRCTHTKADEVNRPLPTSSHL